MKGRLVAAAVAVMLTVAAVVCAPRRAVAQEEPEALIRQGVELRRHGEDARAHGYFQRAYSVAHTPRSAAQLGLVEQALGYFADARAHLAEALASHDAWVNENRSLLDRSRVMVEGQLARVEARGAVAGATVQVEGRAPGPLPDDGTIWLAPGTATLTFAAQARASVTKRLVLAAGDRLVIDVDLLPVAVPGVPGSPGAAADSLAGPAPRAVVTAAAPAGDNLLRVRRTKRIAGVAIGSTGVALGVAGVLAYASGKAELEAIMSDASTGMHYDVGNRNFATLGNVGIGLVVAGIAALAGGAALYFLNRDGEAPF